MSDKAKKFVSKFSRKVTANDVINGCVYDNWKRTEIPDDIREELFEEFKNFVVNGSRAGRRQRILKSKYYTVKSCGILNRLMIDYNRNGNVDYCCGQEWNSEMQTLREVFAGDI